MYEKDVFCTVNFVIKFIFFFHQKLTIDINDKRAFFHNPSHLLILSYVYILLLFQITCLNEKWAFIYDLC